jgi:hypothetical protein
MKRFSRSQTALLLAAVLFASVADAQKKGGGGGASQAAAAAPAAATSSTAPFEVEMLTYGALDTIMERLSDYACKVANTDGGKDPFARVAVLDPPALQALQAYDTFSVNAKALAAAYTAMQGGASAGSGIDDFSDITNAVAAAAIATTSESSFSFTIQDPSAALVLLKHLRAKTSIGCKSAYYAGVYAADEANKPQFRGSDILSVSDQLAALAGLRTSTLSSIMTAGQGNTNPKRAAAGCAPIPSGASAISVGGTPLYPLEAQDPCVTATSTLHITSFCKDYQPRTPRRDNRSFLPYFRVFDSAHYSQARRPITHC